MAFFLSGRLRPVLLYKNNIDFYSCQQWYIQVADKHLIWDQKKKFSNF